MFHPFLTCADIFNWLSQNRELIPTALRRWEGHGRTITDPLGPIGPHWPMALAEVSMMKATRSSKHLHWQLDVDKGWILKPKVLLCNKITIDNFNITSARAVLG